MMFAIAEGARTRLEREHNDRAWLAWNTAALHRVKKMPKLQSLQIKRRSRRPQTWQEQKQVLKLITAAYGGGK